MLQTSSDESLEMLEAIALWYYPGLYVLINEPLDEVLGIPGARAQLLAATSPSFDAATIYAVGIVSTRAPTHSLPEDWRKIIEASKGALWRVDFFVPTRHVAGVRAMAARLNPEVRVRPLPQPNPRPMLVRSAARSVLTR